MKTLIMVLRWVLLVGVVCLVIAQFFGPEKTNPASDSTQAIETHLQVTPQVAAILDRSCIDCHSNKTRWPWYSNVAPVSWFVIGHVNEGRQNLNFSEWGRYTKSDVDGLLKRMCRDVKSGLMSLSSYTPSHPDSTLAAEYVNWMGDWTDA